MDPMKITEHVMRFQKAAFCNAMVMNSFFQEQTMKMTNLFLDQNIWIPETGKEILKHWVEFYSNSLEHRRSCKQTLDDSFKKVEDFIMGVAKHQRAHADSAYELNNYILSLLKTDVVDE